MSKNPVPVRPVYPTNKAIERAAFASWWNAATYNRDAEGACRSLYPNDDGALELIQRASVSGATTGGWASALVASSFKDFIDSLRPDSAAARLIPMGLQLRVEETG